MTHSNWRTCPCLPCLTRKRAYNREYMRDLRKNPAPRLVDAAPSRQRLIDLRAAGMTLKEIAAVSGYSLHTLKSLHTGRVARVRTVMAEDLAMVEAPRHAGTEAA